MKFIDCDRHVMEPLYIWEHYVSEDIYTKFPVHFKESSLKGSENKHEGLNELNQKLPPTYFIGPYPILNKWSMELQLETASRPKNSCDRHLALTGQGQLESMDKGEVSKALIFPTFAGYIVNHNKIPSEVSIGYAQGYNKWILDYCSINRGRLIPVALVSRHDPFSLKAQLKEIIKQGFEFVTIRPEPINGEHLGSQSYNEFWKTCELHDIKIAFHGGTHLHGDTVGVDRFESRFALHACSHAMEAQLAFLSLLEGNVFENFPALKFIFLEAGASWLPYWLWRLDNICYPEFPALIKNRLKSLPSSYFARNCYVSYEPGEPNLHETVKLIGEEKILFGTDFPHPDHQSFSIKELFETPGLTQEQIVKSLLKNPEAIIDIKNEL
ncbi:amidohydrolase family protein [Pseudoalteromonas aurantia]|uniref:Amidohydrolase n=1 Tax=Pseudoalteromonas aurantia TaxID=43654 RepID=A0A5S3VAS7_9GAMM|nr:amidohydrolase family protein [Pseudoalteromonas aurantia]TMO69074.1 amidohydrolase [Pseudoalteromonas aurantia]